MLLLRSQAALMLLILLPIVLSKITDAATANDDNRGDESASFENNNRDESDVSRKPRHVLMFVIDDLGFTDLSYMANMYNVSQVIPTPAIDALALSGVRLGSYYVNKLCSPTRTSLLSGRYAYTIGMQAEVIVDGHPSTMPLSVKTVAEHLSEGGWKTSAYGKWDAGMTSWGCTPTCRGFDHFYGFYNAFNDYFSHFVGNGLDLRNDFDPDFTNNNESGVYMTELMSSRVQQWIKETITGDPKSKTFAYVAHEAVHAPNQVPQRYLDGHCMDTIPNDRPIRQILCGMLRAVDESVRNISTTYKELGIWKDTLVIFTTDNGGNPDTGGSNYPLRGQKATLFEGGVRGAGFVFGAGLSQKVKGSISNELIHVSDWLPTIVGGAAGLPLTNLSKPGMPKPPPLDGVDQWATITKGAPSGRDEALLDLAPNGCQAEPCKIPGQGAIRIGKWKLIRGHTSVWGNPSSALCTQRSGKVQPNIFPLNMTASTSPPWCPNGWTPAAGSSSPQPPPDVGCASLPCWFNQSDYLEGGTWLFDVVSDPHERHNVANQYPDVVANLTKRLAEINGTNIPQENPGVDPMSNPDRFGGVWTPWRGDPVPNHCSTNTSGPPGANLKSNFDGLSVLSNGSCHLQGWAWNPDQPDKGIAPVNVSISMDNGLLVKLVANVNRPGLVPKTGAPNAEHGFVYIFDDSNCQALVHDGDKHKLDVVALINSFPRELQSSPLCYSNASPVAC